MEHIFVLTRCKYENGNYAEYAGVFSSLERAQVLVDSEDAHSPNAHDNSTWYFRETMGTHGAYTLKVVYSSPSGRETYDRYWHIYLTTVDYWYENLKEST